MKYYKDEEARARQARRIGKLAYFHLGMALGVGACYVGLSSTPSADMLVVSAAQLVAFLATLAWKSSVKRGAQDAS